MEINCLLIDDEYDKRAIQLLHEDLEHEVNKSSSVSLTVKIDHVNPLRYITAGFEYQNLFNHLDEKYLTNKLDMLLCDFNLHSNHKHIAFHIISHIRSKNKACTIILFSGSPLKELIRINNDDLATKISEHIIQENATADIYALNAKLEQLRKEEEPAEELLDIAVKSNISAIVSRPKYHETAVKLIAQPSLILWIDNHLLKHGDLVFNDGNEKLNGMKLSQVAKLVREQDEEGIYFTHEILKTSLASLIDDNS